MYLYPGLMGSEKRHEAPDAARCLTVIFKPRRTLSHKKAGPNQSQASLMAAERASPQHRVHIIHDTVQGLGHSFLPLGISPHGSSGPQAPVVLGHIMGLSWKAAGSAPCLGSRVELLRPHLYLKCSSFCSPTSWGSSF